MILENIPNEDYHNRDKYPQLSSSQFKKIIMESPRDFMESLNATSESSPYMNAGSAFHDYNESILKTGLEFEFLQNWTIFEHPRNPKTGEPVGITTKGYLEAFTLAEMETGNAISDIQLEKLEQMQKAFAKHPSTRMVFRNNVEFERSFFVMDNEVEQKIRPDRETDRYIVDLKTCRKGESSLYNVSRLIIDRGYDISAAMYQWLYFVETGIWKPFLWIFVENEYPFQVNYHLADDFAYRVRKLHTGDKEAVAGIGATKYKKAVKVYKECTKANRWGGTETFIQNKYRIGTPTAPNWAKLPDFLI